LALSENPALAEDNAPNERYIEEIGKTADWTLDNNGDVEELHVQVRAFYKERIKIFFKWRDY